MGRFETLYSLPQNLYIEGAPIIVEAGNLLKDTITGSIVAQIKYKSLSHKNINALKIKITIFDITKQPLGEVIEYQYLDLTIRQGQDFGSDKAIIVPNVVARSFSINEITVIFGDNKQWVSNREFDRLVNSQMLKTTLNDDELIKQYRLETNNSANYMPKEMLGLWQCTCGEWNVFNDCNKCRLKKTKVFSSYNIDQLIRSKNFRIEEEIEEEKLKKAICELKEKKRRRCIKIILCFASIMILVFISVLAVSIKIEDINATKAYNAACDMANKYIESGDYDKAYASLEEYPDDIITIFLGKSEEYLQNQNYKKTFECLNMLDDLYSNDVVNFLSENKLGFINIKEYDFEKSLEENTIEMFYEYVRSGDATNAKAAFDYVDEKKWNELLSDYKNGEVIEKGRYLNICAMYIFSSIEQFTGTDNEKMVLSRNIAMKKNENILEHLEILEKADGKGLIVLPEKEMEEFYQTKYEEYKKMEGAYIYIRDNGIMEQELYCYVENYRMFWLNLSGEWREIKEIEYRYGYWIGYFETAVETDISVKFSEDSIVIHDNVYTRIDKSELPSIPD